MVCRAISTAAGWGCASLDLALRISVLSRGVANLLKYGGDVYKQNKNVMAALKAAAKPTIGAMIKTTG